MNRAKPFWRIDLDPNLVPPGRADHVSRVESEAVLVAKLEGYSGTVSNSPGSLLASGKKAGRQLFEQSLQARSDRNPPADQCMGP
jgi:hypothetical protein